MAFRKFQPNPSVVTPRLVRPAAVDLEETFPGIVVLSAEVCVFGGDGALGNPTTEASIKVSGVTQNGAHMTGEVGRYDADTNSPRLTLSSVWAWAEAHELSVTHNRKQDTTANGEPFTVQYLQAAALIRKGGFNAA
jgi:hypothetical protein